VVSFLEKGKVGIFAPLEEQIEETKRKWKKTGLKVAVEALNPYQESPKHDRAIERMRREKVDLVVLDCIGYSKRIKEKIRHIVEKPVLLPRTLLARAIKELI
jgi:protein AroM